VSTYFYLVRRKILYLVKHILLFRGKVALDMLHRAMCLALHRRIVIAIEMAHEGGAFFTVVDILSCITIAKRPCYG
jgi:hypothetical protein